MSARAEQGTACLEAALHYARDRGWAVFPLHTPGPTGCSCARPARGSVGKHPRTPGGFKDATRDPRVITAWWTRWPDANIAIATGSSSGVVVLDVDGEAAERIVVEFGLEEAHPPVVITGRGRHLCFAHPETTIASRAGVRPCFDVRGDGGYIVAPPSVHASGVRYAWADAEAAVSYRALPPLPDGLRLLLSTPAGAPPTTTLVKRTGREPLCAEDTIARGTRNDTLARVAGRFLALGLSQVDAELAVLGVNARQCSPALPDAEVIAVVRSIGARHASHASDADVDLDPAVAAWPVPLRAEAFHGVAGRIVKVLAPHTEAATAGLLACLLAGVGNAIGRATSIEMDGRDHALNLFVLLVGPTSAGRKGTAWSRAEGVLREADPGWATACVASGLSSGEGLLDRVRDGDGVPPQTGSGSPTAGRESTGSHRGAIAGDVPNDKRVLIVEEEFAQALRAMQREGNTLSAVLRMAWDGRPLATLTRKHRTTVTGAHISLLAQITPDELRRLLPRTELSNGLMNRIMLIAVRRPHLLADGGSADPARLTPLVAELQAALAFARRGHRLVRDAGATRRWRAVYAGLSEGPPGLLGELTARAAPQVMRLAGIYAVLDQATSIREEHLEAALAFWEYAARSAAYVFAHMVGDPVRDRLLEALRERPLGITRTEIRDLFHRGRKRADITAALQSLADAGLAHVETQPSGGRPTERWFASLGAQPIESTEPMKADRHATRAHGVSLMSVSSVRSDRVEHGRG